MLKRSANDAARGDIEARVEYKRKQAQEALAQYVIDLEEIDLINNEKVSTLLDLGQDKGWIVAGTFIIPSDSKDQAIEVYKEWLFEYNGSNLFDHGVDPMEEFERGQLVNITDYVS